MSLIVNRSRLASGVLWYGPTRHLGGYGNATRAYLRALLRLGWRVRSKDVNVDHSRELDPAARDLVLSTTGADVGMCPIEILHTDPRSYDGLGTLAPAARVGVSVFETMSIPDSWVAPLRKMDAVWVPTSFHRETFAKAGIDRERISIVPFAIDTDFFAPLPRLASDLFRFSYVSVWDRRKGLDVLVRAFLEEFGADEPAELVLQTSIPDKTGDQAHAEALERLAAMTGEKKLRHRIELRTRPLSQLELRDLYAETDLYISTDRNNIWTLPCIEMLAMGRPCATTDFARATGWLSDDNPLLIRCDDELAPTDPELARLRPLYAGQMWAQFSVEEVRRAMRWAFENRAALADLARRGREYVLATHSIDAVAPHLATALDKLDLRLPRLRPKRALFQLAGVDTTRPAPLRRAVLDRVKPMLRR